MDISSHTAEASVPVQSSDQDTKQGRSDSSRRVPRAHRLLLAKAHVEDNLHQAELTPSRTAAALGISVRQLHMLFEPTGTSFASYLLLRRLERARTLLAEQPDVLIMDVAGACGIRSSTVFYRGFQQTFGMTPMEHRRAAAAASHDGANTPSPDD
jgi:AraC-like DNA-binding protein